jgi:hypothetical protein
MKSCQIASTVRGGMHATTVHFTGNRVTALSIAHIDWYNGPSWQRDKRCRSST